MTKAYLPERFVKVLTLHIAKNLMDSLPAPPPLILAIHGPSGEGKTYQCEKTLDYLGITPLLVSGGQLESGEAGEPARLIRSTYLRGGSLDHAKRSALLINDIDTGAGNWGDLVQYTVNRQHIFAELMHLADYPTNVEGRATRRVPIIVTGNDLSKLYTPLLRSGRMASFEWIPNECERNGIVQAIFPELSDEDVSYLIGVLADERKASAETPFNRLSIAFFAHLRSRLTDDILWATISELGLPRAISLIQSGRAPVVREVFDVSRLVMLGKELITEHVYNDHLKS